MSDNQLIRLVYGSGLVSVQVWTNELKGRPFPGYAILCDINDDGTIIDYKGAQERRRDIIKNMRREGKVEVKEETIELRTDEEIAEDNSDEAMDKKVAKVVADMNKEYKALFGYEPSPELPIGEVQNQIKAAKPRPYKL